MENAEIKRQQAEQNRKLGVLNAQLGALRKKSVESEEIQQEEDVLDDIEEDDSNPFRVSRTKIKKISINDISNSQF